MQPFKLLLALCVVGCLATSPMLAGDTGKIAGKVTDAKTGEALPGAIVMVEGTKAGASVDVDGSYFIINMPPGRYSVRVSLMGYTAVVKKNVDVRIDQTTRVDFELAESAIQVQEVVIVAKAPPIQKDRISSQQSFDADQIQSATIEKLDVLLGLQVGVNAMEITERPGVISHNPGDGLHIRGGRENETAFLIDGIRVENPLWGGSGYVQNTSGSTIGEMSTIIGTFNAEYGGKTAGVVNLITKEGGDEFSVRFDGYTDKIGIPRYDRNTVSLDLTVGGPVALISNLSFFSNFQMKTTDGRFRGYIVPNWTDLKGMVPIFDAQGNPLGEKVSTNWRDDWNGMAKLTWRPIAQLKLSASYTASHVKELKFEHEYTYLPNSMPWMDMLSDGVTIRVTHQVFHQMFYEAYASVQRIEDWIGVHKTREQRIVSGSREPDPVYGFYYSGAYQDYWADTSLTYQAGISITNQLDNIHMLKMGYDIRSLDLNQRWDNAWTTPVLEIVTGVDANGNPVKQIFENHKTFARIKPREMSAYVQDKMEFESIGMVVNLGFRWEQWMIPLGYLVNPEDPLKTPLQSATPKNRLSPRLGISYPVFDRAAFHFAYGHFYQMPSYKDLMANINQRGQYPDRPNLQDIGIAMFNPDMKPEHSVTYEAGVQVSVAQDITANVTAFYREMHDLLGVRWIRNAAYVMYDNVDFGNSKGVEVNLVKPLSDGLAFRLNYALSQTLISSSSPITAAQSVGTTPLAYRTYPANWDRTHDFSGMVTLSVPWDILVGLTGQLKSGRPYTVLAEQPNTERMPTVTSFDLSLRKSFALFGFKQAFYFQVFNLLDQANVLSVYTTTGRWDDDGDPSTPRAHDANPKRISDGRRLRVGIRFTM